MTKFERLMTTHRDAELCYRRLVARSAKEDNALVDRVATSNARAEGLAEAIGILTGRDVVDVRARVRAELDRVAGDGLTGCDGLRATLAAHRR